MRASISAKSIGSKVNLPHAVVRCFVSLLVVGSAFAQAPAPQPSDEAREFRSHVRLRTADGLGDFTVTVINSLSDTQQVNKALVQDASGGRYILGWVRDFVHQTSTREIVQVGGTEYVRYTLFLPYSAKTRVATQKEAHEHPELMNDKNARFELSTAGNASISGIADFWKDPATARDWRSRARLMISASFLDAIEYMETVGLFRRADFPDFDAIVMPLILYRTECEARDDLISTALVPDCGFDAKFGYECSDKQKDRADRLAREKPPLAKPY